MPEPSKMDLEARLYFNSLPPVLQEQLMQSSAELNTKEDLMRYCSNALGKEAPKGQGWTKTGRGSSCRGPLLGVQRFFVPQVSFWPTPGR